MLESLFNKVADLLQHMCFLVNIAKIFDSISPVASVDLLFLIKRQCGMISTKKVRSWHSTRYLNTLLVETISTRFSKPFQNHFKTCPKQTTAAKELGSLFFDNLIANINGGSDPYKACHFLRDFNKNFHIHIRKLL